MKEQLVRYGIPIAFIVFIAVCISTFYTLASESRYPEFTMVTLYGDEVELENVSLRGGYQDTYHHRSLHLDRSMTIDSEGSHYYADQSFFARLNGVYNEEMKQLIKDYRQFMRSKGSLNAFYHDNEYLLYVNVEGEYFNAYDSEGSYFDVAVLDKKTNNTSSFKLNFPDSHLYRYINMLEVQLFGDEIVVVTSNYLESSNETEYHRYTFDLNQGSTNRITHQQIEFPFAVDSSDGFRNVTTVFQSKATEPTRYIVFYGFVPRQSPSDHVKAVSEAIDHEVASPFIYDLQTGQLEIIQSVEILDALAHSYMLDHLHSKQVGEKLYITTREDEAVRVILYNIVDSSAQTYEINVKDADLIEVSGDRLYALSGITGTKMGASVLPKLKIFDLESKQLVYEGKLDVASSKFDLDVIDDLYIHQIVLR